MYGFHDTFISYGLTDGEQIALNKWYNDSVEPTFPGIKHLDTNAFTDVLAVPAFMVIIRFSSLSEDEAEIFNECFQDFDATILSLDEPEFETRFEYQQAELDELLNEAINVISRHLM